MIVPLWIHMVELNELAAAAVGTDVLIGRTRLDLQYEGNRRLHGKPVVAPHQVPHFETFLLSGGRWALRYQFDHMKWPYDDIIRVFRWDPIMTQEHVRWNWENRPDIRPAWSYWSRP